MEEFGKLEERVVLVGVQTDDHDNVEESLDELKELASTAGAAATSVPPNGIWRRKTNWRKLCCAGRNKERPAIKSQ